MSVFHESQNMDPEHFWQILETTIDEVKGRNVMRTPKKMGTPFRQQTNNAFSDSRGSYMDSPTTKMLHSPRIRERISEEIRKQVVKERKEYFEEMKDAFDQLQREVDQLKRDNARLTEQLAK